MFFITVLLAILGLVGTDIFAPSLPAIAKLYHQAPQIAQLTITLFLAGFSISQLFYGPLSDYFGRKPLLIIGILIFMLGSWFCIVANNFSFLCVGRIIQGIGVGAGLSLARVIIRDVYKDHLLAVRTAQVGMFVSLTPPLAPLIGGFLQQHMGTKGSFIFLFLYGLLLLILLVSYFKETIVTKNKVLSRSHILTEYLNLLKNKIFMRYSFVAGLGFGVIILYANVLPFIIQSQLKFCATANGMFLLLGALGISLGSFISSRIVKRISSKRLIDSGLALLVLGGIFLALTECLFGANIFFLIPCIFVISIACGLIFPNAIVLCFSNIETNIGIAGALYGTIQMCISMLINLVLNTISTQDQLMLGLFYLLMGIGGLILTGILSFSFLRVNRLRVL